jgi:hypothetical protein
MTWLAGIWATLIAKPWFAALVKWLAIAGSAAVALLVALGWARRQGADQQRTKQAEAGADLAKRQASVPQPLPGQTENRLDKGTF